MLTILILLGSLFLAEKTSLHKCVLKRKNAVCWVEQKKNSGRVNDSPLGRENVRVGLFCYKSCLNLVLRKEEFLPSMVAELGWAGS